VHSMKLLEILNFNHRVLLEDIIRLLNICELIILFYFFRLEIKGNEVNIYGSSPV